MTRYLSPFGWLVAGAIVFWTILLFWVCGAWAAGPYLTCDCTPTVDKVTSFQLQFGTAAWIDSSAVLTCGSGAGQVICTGEQRTVCHDLAFLPSGAFTLKGRASNVWGQSNDSVPFSDTKTLPSSSPLLLRVVK